YVKNHPTVTVAQLIEVFPNSLLKGYGVIRSGEVPPKDPKRFYMSQLPDGTVFYICNQWGKDATENFVKYVNKNIDGIKVTMV
ncbi:MAG: hypothetical protein II308_01555, partial [Muribaculaceae bacterium]|nr:hypothetical protein [Muribaculaceae bacterium]